MEGRKGEFGNFLIVFHTYYPAYHIGAFFLTEQSLHYGILFVKTFYNVVSSIICCAKKARASIFLD